MRHVPGGSNNDGGKTDGQSNGRVKWEERYRIRERDSKGRYCIAHAFRIKIGKVLQKYKRYCTNHIAKIPNSKYKLHKLASSN